MENAYNFKMKPQKYIVNLQGNVTHSQLKC